jgi:di/tricarboxylate transporter
MTDQMAIAAGITLSVLLALTLTRIRTELVLMGAMLALSLTNVLTPAEALAGFASPGVLTIGALYVVVGGLTETGAVAWLSQIILRRPGSIVGAQSRLLAVAGLVSTVVNHTPVVAMFIPIAQQWSTRHSIPSAKLLLPMNHVAMLGGMCTLIGTATALAVNGLLVQMHPESQLHLFDLAWVGVPVTVAGTIYCLLFAERLLPDRTPPIEQLHNAREYSVQMRIQPNGPLVGKSIGEVGLRSLRSAYVVEIERNGGLILGVGPEELLQRDDVLTCVGVVDAVKELRKIPGLSVPEEQTYRFDLKNWQRQLVEIVLSAQSPLIGKTVRDANFRTQYRAAIVSISRDGQRISGKLGDVALKGGDTLLVEAGPDFVTRHRHSREFLLVSPVENSQPADFRKAPVAIAILIAMVIADFLGIAPLFAVSFIAAGLMIATGCITNRLANQSIDYPVVAAVAASYALGVALDKSGAAGAIAAQVMQHAGRHPMFALTAVYAVTAACTQLVTHAATGVLMFPVALAVAKTAGSSHMPFVVAVIIGACSGFVTPFGHQTNLMVYGAGGYRFSDFVRFGLPLAVITGVLALWIIPHVWPF